MALTPNGSYAAEGVPGRASQDRWKHFSNSAEAMMPTKDAHSLPDEEEDDDDNTTKCVCTICEHALSVSKALECDECGCFFCSPACAQKNSGCNGKIHR